MKELLQSLPPEIATFIISMMPVIELRGGIPFGIGVLKMAPWYALIWGLLGNALAALILLYILEPIRLFSEKYFKPLHKLSMWVFDRTRNKHSKRMSELGHLALILFVAVPLPGSGAWTGALVAYLFGVERKKAFGLISAGLIIAGTLVAFGTKAILRFFF